MILALVLAVVHSLAFEYFWYWQYWWLDLVMHFGAGVFVAGIVYISGVTKRTVLLVAIALVVGRSWEVLELVFRVPYSRSFVLDTGLDLLMDAAGALALSGMLWWWRIAVSPSSAVRAASLDQTF